MTLDNISPTLTDEQKGRIYGILAVGCDRQTAADYIGCSLADLRNMMQRDSAFAKDVRRAEAEIELKHMNIVKKQPAIRKNGGPPCGGSNAARPSDSVAAPPAPSRLGN